MRARENPRRATSATGEDMISCSRCGVNLPRSDAREESALAPLVKEADVLIPLAALVGVPVSEADPVGVPTAAFIETDLVLVFDHLTHTLSAAFLLVALIFVWRSFYGMRIESGK